LVVSIVNSVIVALLMLAGTSWGALGIASARIAAVALVTPWALRYGFSNTPVSTRDFVVSFSEPCFAGAIMAVAALEVRSLTMSIGPVLSLVTGVCASGAVYLLILSALPGSRAKLRGLLRDLVEVVRARRHPQATGVSEDGP
jgi:hypothetical protein